MREFLINLIQDYWQMGSTALLGIIIRAIEKARMKKRYSKNGME